MKLFVDDQWELPERFPGTGWVFSRTASAAIALLQTNQGKITHLSLDYDLDDGGNGGEITAWLASQWYGYAEDFWPTKSISVHSRNPVGRACMIADIKNVRFNPRPWMLK